jgi:hypothetical protein
MYLHIGVSDCFDISPLWVLRRIMCFSIATKGGLVQRTENGEEDCTLWQVGKSSLDQMKLFELF